MSKRRIVGSAGTIQASQAKSKEGFAVAALVLGILAFITTLLLVNYLLALLALIFGIIYLVKKADVKPKGKAITGIVLAVISIVLSTVIWISTYMYIVKTDVYTILEDVAAVFGEEIDGRETIDDLIQDASEGIINVDIVEEFIGGEVSIERLKRFLGDITDAEFTDFLNEVAAMDQEQSDAILSEFQGEITHEKLQEKLGKNFTIREVMDFVRNYQ